MASAKPTQTPDDVTLIQGILAGDTRAFDALHAKYERRIYFYALKRMRNAFDAEDVTQEVFLQVFCGLASYEGRSTLLTWMFGIAHNQVCRRFRRRDSRLVAMDSAEIENLQDREVSADRRTDFVRILRNCSRDLDEKVGDEQRTAFHLRYVENHSMREIAEELGKSPQAIKISLFRTRRTLAQNNRDLGVLLSA